MKGGELGVLEILNDFPKPTLVKRVGVGAFESVYKSKWLGLPSATKTMKFPKDYFGFRKDVGILAGLSHPNLIKSLSCEIDKEYKEFHLVMEVVDMDLTNMWEKLNKRLLQPVVAFDDVLRIGSGMCCLYEIDEGHLDLEPNNVLLRSMTIDGAKDTSPYHYTDKLIDYGTSKVEVQSKPQMQKHEDIVGTPRYMAPEASEKNVASMPCPFQADVWSFGMMRSEILLPKAPFHHTDGTMREIIKNIKKDETPKLPINCGELTKLIEECWRKDPLQRPTFSNICKRLVGLRKMFMQGTYASDMIPQFDGVGNVSQKMSTILEGCKGATKHGSEKVSAISITMRSLL